MSYVRIWLHCVWGTKKHDLLLTPDIRKAVFDHIRENAKAKEIYLDAINGSSDHVHCLISMNPDQSIAKVMQLLKGESSFWINRNKIIDRNFEWADEYFSVSVSESQVSRVRKYIWNQEKHHKKGTWEHEYHDFMKSYGFKIVDGKLTK